MIRPISKKEKNSDVIVVSNTSSVYSHPSIDRISEAKPGDVQKIAASQIELLNNYHQEVLDQAKKSFRSAWFAAGLGFTVFMVSIFVILLPQNENRIEAAVLGTVGGVLIEVISAVNFSLYNKAASRMDDFQQRLDKTQRFLLANSICEGLEGRVQQQVRAELVRTISGEISIVNSDISKDESQDNIRTD